MPMVKRPLLGAFLIFGGAWAIIFGVIWNLVNYEDEGPRCTVAACSQSALNWYWFVAETSASIVVVGAVLLILGVWLILRKAAKSSAQTNPHQT
jgi:ABC-type antimicrobial peptide transport system permease subunit